MKQMITTLLILLCLHSAAQDLKGEIAGRVLDEKKEPMINAAVQVYQSGILKGGNISDFDGNYLVQPLAPGHYNIVFLYTGYDSMVVTDVLVTSGNRTTVNCCMKSIAGHALKACTIMAYKVPLVNHDNKSTILTRDAINIPPVQAVTDIPSISSNVYQQQRGAALQSATKFFDPSEPSYKKNPENDFMNVKANPVSTMSVDVDRASYSNVRRFINEGNLPPADAVRVEEMVNYFDYDYPQPDGKEPIAIKTELVTCPWQENHKLLHIGIQAMKVSTENLPPSNLVFLIDVSGSMDSPERLPLIIEGMKLLVLNLRPIDKVAIVTYAGNAGLALPPTAGNKKQKILDALDKLRAGGSTAGGEGIKLAYKIAEDNFIEGGNNRVLLATDGDFNVGVSSDNELEDLITKKRETGVFLTCLGVGTDNYKDAKMEMMADKGNGNYDYIDNLMEAQKTLENEFGGTLFTIAKDVKAQIEFNPAKVQGYRLIGYEDRLLNTEDFKDDKKDAGDMGSGHTVTVMYEIIPTGIKSDDVRPANDLKYQIPANTPATYSDELATIKFRYKKPDGDKSKEITHVIPDNTIDFDEATENTRFSAGVAMFGMLLKGSPFKGSSTYADVIKIANNSKTFDKDNYRTEFVQLVKTAMKIDKKTAGR